MPEINSGVKTQTIVLPDYPESKVVLCNSSEKYIELLMGGEADIETVSSLKAIMTAVKEWDITENGKVLSITAENIKRLPFTSLTFLLTEVNKFLGFQKKTS